MDVVTSNPPSLPFTPGHRLDRYELLCPIATGGMASVWVARVTGKHGFEKLVAVKTILPALASSKRFRDMFIDESRIVAGIEHPNVAQIFDVGEEHGTLFLVMEYVDGEALSKVMRVFEERGERVPVGVMMRVLADTCGGLHAAHVLKDKATGRFRGVVHRDVSPQNILVNTAGTAKLIDFGVAKAKDRLAQKTNAGALKGKVQYMAPEHALGGEVDRRADVWAVGAILYQSITGAEPYAAENEMASLHRIGSRAPIPPVPLSVDRSIRELIERALSYDPEGRFPTALETQRALEETMKSAGVQTTNAEVAMFIERHMAMRIEQRRRAVDYALKASADRGHVALLLAPEHFETSDELLAAHARIAADDKRTEVGVGPALLDSGAPNKQVRVRLEKNEEIAPAFVEARTAAPSNHPPPPVPELVLPPPPPKPEAAAKPPPPPPSRAAPGTARQAAPRAYVPPAVMIASAAGSIIGDDVRNLAPLPDPQQSLRRPRGGEAPGEGATASPKDSFIDPAKIAQARAVSAAPTRVPLTNDAPKPGDAQVLSGVKPAKAVIASSEPEKKRKAEEAARATSRKIVQLVLAFFALVGLVVLAMALAPGYARGRAIDWAARQGVTLEIDHVTTGATSVRLTGLRAGVAELPFLHAKAAEATIILSWFSPESVVVKGAEIAIDEVPEDASGIGAAIAKWNAARVSQASPSTLRISLLDGHVTWPSFIERGGTLEASGAAIELQGGPSGIAEVLQISAPRVTLGTARGTLGPWRLDTEVAPKHSRLRVAFDPDVKDGPSLLLVRGAGNSATLNIQRSPIARLGIPEEIVGLEKEEDTQVEASMQMSQPIPGRTIGEGALTVHDARLKGAKQKIDIKLTGSIAGDPSKPLEITKGSIAFGALRANLVGVLALLDDAFKLDITWKVPPTPCGVLLKAKAPGEASGEGFLTFDSRIPDRASFTLVRASTCGVSLFPPL
jgi:serine/threonine-protein kinase